VTNGDAGANEGFVEELYEQYRTNPESVSPRWREYFTSGTSGGNGQRSSSPAPAVAAPPPVPAPSTAPAAPVTSPATPSSTEARPPTASAPVPPPSPASGNGGGTSTEARRPLRGVQARIVENMEASLEVPTATSVRTVPAKLLEVNRQILNNHLGRTGRAKVSFTHLIAFAVVRALRDFPNINSSFELSDGAPTVTRHAQVNLGLAVDVERADGSRTLLVPNIKGAESLDFAHFREAYEELITKVRYQKVSPDDFAGTTGTITNPGMIGTVHSVPRLMPGQGFILGVGAIGYPSEYEGSDPQALARMGVSTVTTLTNTYDHRIISGAESGEFLRRIHDLLLGGDAFYDDVFRSLAVPYEPARWIRDHAPLDPETTHEKVVQVHQLINMYRVRGHLIANLDPLGRRDPSTHPELDITHHGLSIWDLDREFPIGSLGAGRIPQRRLPLRDILGCLRDAYARTVGVEYMHIQEPDQKEWIQERVEIAAGEPSAEEKRRVLDRLIAAEAFERFVHTKYLGQKRFSLEGAETLIPMLDTLCSAAADSGTAEIVIGMAHRGRLNVLANIVGKSTAQIFREFEGELDPTSTQGSGDVKYHLGAKGKHRSPAGNRVKLTLAANPSHLEAVDAVVEGMARAKGDRRGDISGAAVLPLLIHGDAAFAGQGVVAETLNLSEVEGYDVGGTVHVVVNNQLGFTTSPESGRSSVYATDVAKMVQAPIFHVNGDDPEAAVRVMRLAFEFRQTFQKDVVVDLFCYRRYGHNEGDEPAFTQPGMYALIDARPSVRALYTDQLVAKGDLTAEECDEAAAKLRARLDQAFEETHSPHDTGLDPRGPTLDDVRFDDPAPDGAALPAELHDAVPTAVSHAALERVVQALESRPDGFTVHPKLERVLQANRLVFEQGEVDWALAESCALGTLLMEGTPVRLAGQDTRRGTFSQRHGVIVDHERGVEYLPLAHLSPEQAPFRLYDSVLSEYAALGFEYGYSVADPRSFVAWEAQFGDFANGAQIILDQFLVAAQGKWGQESSLALLLPHGLEGQGPEHSSARIERYLTLCAEDNLRVVYPSTAAQYFHVLRRQAKTSRRVPLVCFTPKRYLRMSQSRSPVTELTDGGFHLVLDDRAAATLETSAVRRVVLCSGKVAHELMDARDERGAPVAVVRVEQLYPWPETELVATLARYPALQQLWWIQEEPGNMGAWNFAHGKLLRLAHERKAEVRHVARRASASPASGSIRVHEREQAELLTAALS
jgi:multifunctional 2-oxoglutarate metabolism enzyme